MGPTGACTQARTGQARSKGPLIDRETSELNLRPAYAPKGSSPATVPCRDPGRLSGSFEKAWAQLEPSRKRGRGKHGPRTYQAKETSERNLRPTWAPSAFTTIASDACFTRCRTPSRAVEANGGDLQTLRGAGVPRTGRCRGSPA